MATTASANASNPLIPQGTLNRLRASVSVVSDSSLNVTSPYLTKAGLSLSLEGESTTYIRTMTGAITSCEPYMMFSVTMNLASTNGLAAIYKARMENISTIGDIIITPDTSGLPTYYGNNCAIESVRELAFAGESGSFVVVLKGYYVLNAALWNLT